MITPSVESSPCCHLCLRLWKPLPQHHHFCQEGSNCSRSSSIRAFLMPWNVIRSRKSSSESQVMMVFQHHGLPAQHFCFFSFPFGFQIQNFVHYCRWAPALWRPSCWTPSKKRNARRLKLRWGFAALRIKTKPCRRMIWTKSKAGWGFPSWRGSPAGPLDLSSSRIIECTRDVCYLSSSSLIADISLFALTSASNTPFYPFPGMNRGWPMCSDKGFLLFWPNWVVHCISRHPCLF